MSTNDLLAILYSAEGGEWFTIDELRLRLRWPRRAVENAIEHLRLEGVPIVAGSDGVRISASTSELADYIDARRRRAAEIHRGTMKLRSTLRRLQEKDDASGGLTLWDAA